MAPPLRVRLDRAAHDELERPRHTDWSRRSTWTLTRRRSSSGCAGIPSWSEPPPARPPRTASRPPGTTPRPPTAASSPTGTGWRLPGTGWRPPGTAWPPSRSFAPPPAAARRARVPRVPPPLARPRLGAPPPPSGRRRRRTTPHRIAHPRPVASRPRIAWPRRGRASARSPTRWSRRSPLRWSSAIWKNGRCAAACRPSRARMDVTVRRRCGRHSSYRCSKPSPPIWPAILGGVPDGRSHRLGRRRSRSRRWDLRRGVPPSGSPRPRERSRQPPGRRHGWRSPRRRAAPDRSRRSISWRSRTCSRSGAGRGGRGGTAPPHRGPHRQALPRRVAHPRWPARRRHRSRTTTTWPSPTRSSVAEAAVLTEPGGPGAHACPGNNGTAAGAFPRRRGPPRRGGPRPAASPAGPASGVGSQP